MKLFRARSLASTPSHAGARLSYLGVWLVVIATACSEDAGVEASLTDDSTGSCNSDQVITPDVELSRQHGCTADISAAECNPELADGAEQFLMELVSSTCELEFHAVAPIVEEGENWISTTVVEIQLAAVGEPISSLGTCLPTIDCYRSCSAFTGYRVAGNISIGGQQLECIGGLARVVSGENYAGDLLVSCDLASAPYESLDEEPQLNPDLQAVAHWIEIVAVEGNPFEVRFTSDVALPDNQWGAYWRSMTCSETTPGGATKTPATR